ncbi:hypothetical protein BWD42_07785 [Sphingobacterium sp. CZ-UAM]|uniref:two-component regulator propeller domain-containing protein n=1 Tax=Sphingobacterium sp. CZ-UAM TaxID=1933868 RepID=UPI0009853896|nr:two-component regulator propeller domain-containing protein [Sphingobacterium sp. CZ-UAM]OOG19789.1 hypothetical protein BWD42_07785 [Sphingobacterium sp. CZ-UAM]
MLKTNILVVLFCCVMSLEAQELLFSRLTSEDGLAPGAVLSITQDANGFMWFGTQNGLTRFDTHRFKTYTRKLPITASTQGNYITQLLYDSQDRLWIGTRNGLNSYNSETDELDEVLLSATKADQPVNISCIYEDRQKNIWIWSSIGLYLKNKGPSTQFRLIAIPDSVGGLATNNNARTIYQDQRGSYWIGSSAGLTEMTRNKEKIKFKSYRHKPSDKSSLSDNYVTVITGDHSNTLWIGTQQGGVNRFDTKKQSFKHIQSSGANGLVNNNIRDLKLDATGKLWIATQGGISVYKSQSGDFKNYRSVPNNQQTLSHNSVYSIFFDQQASAWIGTYWGGVNSIAIDNTPFQNYGTNADGIGINNNVISAIAEDKSTDRLLVGTEGGGINIIDRRTRQIIRQFTYNPLDPNSLGSDLVKLIYRDRDGNFWIGTHGGGLNLYDATNDNFTRFFYTQNDTQTRNAEALAICESTTGLFWIGTQTGLLAFKRSGRSLLPLPQNKLSKAIGARMVKTILQARTGDIWVGTSSHLFRMKNGKITQFPFSEQFPLDNINCIYEDKNGEIWVGSAASGLFRYDEAVPKIKFRRHTKAEGLPSNNIVAILEDDGQNLWISTGNGLSKLDMRRNLFKNYNKDDGLSSNIFNINSCYKSSSGEMFFGGYNGLTYFYPDQISENTFAPPTFMTGLKLFDHQVHIGKPDDLLNREISGATEISFTHKQNVFTLEFATLNYVQPSKNRYAYKMEGFDDSWNYADQPTATYMNLPAGKYTFLAKGSNNDGVWGQSTQLQIVVRPPFWKTIWAYLFYLLLLAIIVFLFIRFFVLRSMVKRDQELTRLKLDFFTNISHEMRSRLALIMAPVEKMLLLDLADKESIRQLRIIRKNSESLLHLLTELMDFRRAESGNLILHPEKVDVVSFLREIYLTFEDWAIASGIRSEFLCHTGAIYLYFDRVQLEKVFYNLYFNAYKFTPSGGFVVTQIEDKNNSLVITIRDNGKGITPENLSKIFTNYFQEDDQSTDHKGYGIGLALAKSIIELHHGTISVTSSLSQNGNITVFTIILRKNAIPESTSRQPNKDPENKEVHVNRPLFDNFIVSPELPLPESMIAQITEKRHTILLIEDNAEILQLNKEMLEKKYKIATCTNGLDGWDTAIELIPDVIVSDVMMPGINGYDLCYRLKADERTNHIPIILITAMISSQQLVQGLQHGADIYIGKPFSIQALALQISNLLSLREKIQQQRNKQLIQPLQQTKKHDQFNSATAPITDPFLDKVIDIIQRQLDDPGFNVDMISKHLNMSRPILYKKLHMLTGLTVNDFLKAIRMKKAMEYLNDETLNISEIAYKVGYSDLKYFSREFKKYSGKTPRDWRRKPG